MPTITSRPLHNGVHMIGCSLLSSGQGPRRGAGLALWTGLGPRSLNDKEKQQGTTITMAIASASASYCSCCCSYCSCCSCCSC